MQKNCLPPSPQTSAGYREEQKIINDILIYITLQDQYQKRKEHLDIILYNHFTSCSRRVLDYS